MSTYSPSLRIELIDNGTQAGIWGNTTNGNLAYVLDSSIAGYQTVSVIAASQALTYTSGPTSTASANQSVYAMLRFTTTTGAAFAVYAPPVSKAYIVWNDSGHAMTIYNSTVIGNTTAAGAGVTVADGSKIMIWSNATNFYELQAANLTATLAVSKGGTGQSSNLTQYGVIYGASTTAMGTTAAGTSVQVLHGNASGAPTWGAVALGTDVSGTLPIANGGTNSTATPTNGGITYGTGTAQAYSAAGTSGQVLQSNGAAAPTWIAQSSIAAGSATNAGTATLATLATLATTATLATLATLATQASSALIRSWGATPAGGGTSVTFVGIPSGVKRVTVMLKGVSTNTAGGAGGDIQIQIGSGSMSTSGYEVQTAFITGSSALAVSYSSGFVVANSTGAVYAYTGTVTLTLIDSNIWTASGNVGTGPSPSVIFMITGVSPNLGGALDRVRVTTAGGTDSFDAGTINILYE